MTCQRMDAQDRTQWRLGCKNHLTLFAEKNCWAPGGGRRWILITEQNDDDVN